MTMNEYLALIGLIWVFYEVWGAVDLIGKAIVAWAFRTVEQEQARQAQLDREKSEEAALAGYLID